MLKVDLHTHTADDPHDRISYSAFDLIDRAASLGYNALAITLHDRQIDLRPLAPYAEERGIVLIPGIERTVQGRHVLLLNFRNGTETVQTFDDIARLKRRMPNGLVVAPHPFFPAGSCLRGLMDRHAQVFDAVECNAMFTRQVDFNRRAERWAAEHGKPLTGNGDVHRLEQLGTCYSLVDAEADADTICQAIAAGRVRVERRPLTCVQAARLCADLVLGGMLSRVMASPRPDWATSEAASGAIRS